MLQGSLGAQSFADAPRVLQDAVVPAFRLVVLDDKLERTAAELCRAVLLAFQVCSAAEMREVHARVAF